MGTRRHGQGGTCPSLAMSNVLWISNYSNTLSRPIIYALFWKFVVSGAPSLDSTGDFCPRTPNLPPLKKSCGCPWLCHLWFVGSDSISSSSSADTSTLNSSPLMTLLDFTWNLNNEFYQLINTTFANHFWSAGPTLHFMKYQTFYYNNQK